MRQCPNCKDIFFTEIEEEKEYGGYYLCLNCMTIFDNEGNIIEKG